MSWMENEDTKSMCILFVFKIGIKSSGSQEIKFEIMLHNIGQYKVIKW